MDKKIIAEYAKEFLESSYYSRYKKKPNINSMKSWYFAGNPCTDACINKAYDDFKRNLRGIGKMQVGKKEQFKIDVKELIKTRIEKLGSSFSQTEFDDWHKTLCNDIISIAGKYDYLIKTELVSYGIAQKWVNMTLKYLIIIGEYESLPLNYLHVPVDRYILKAAAKKDNANKYALKMEIAPQRKNKSGDKSISLGYYSDTNTKPWSKYSSYDEYFVFQKKLREILSSKTFSGKKFLPIQWEGKAWIEQANLEKR